MICWLMAVFACGGNTPAPPKPPAQATAPAEQPKAEPPSPEEAKPPLVYQDWDWFMTNGCNLQHDKLVWNPLELRILRNVPYAQRGWRFTAPELAAYFTAVDPNYSLAGNNDDILLSETEKACVVVLKAKETQLRETIEVPPEAEARMVSDPGSYHAWSSWRRGDEHFYKYLSFTPREDGGWTMGVPNFGCYLEAQTNPDVDCGGDFLICEGEDEPCYPVAPG